MRQEIASIIQEYLLELISIFHFDQRTLSSLQEHLSLHSIQNSLHEENGPNEIQILWFDEIFEDQFYRYLFEKENIPEVYHYTTFKSLFNIIDSAKIRLSSITGLNDRSELSFADKVLGKKVLQVYHHKRIDSANKRFVLSCSSKNDNLNQWRLYGDNGSGAQIGLKVDPLHISSHYFAIGKVFYGDSFFNIISRMNDDLIKIYQSKLTLRRFFLWKNFVKPTDYSDEDEYRILFINDGRKGMTTKQKWYVNIYNILTSSVEFDLAKHELPLRIESIKLGPKCHEKQLNVAQLKHLTKHAKLKFKSIDYSTKDHYR